MRPQLLPGWFRSGGDGTALPGHFSLAVTVAGSLADFDASAFEMQLREYLQCRAPACAIALQLQGASVRVKAAVNDTTAASVAAAAILTGLSEQALSEVLG